MSIKIVNNYQNQQKQFPMKKLILSIVALMVFTVCNAQKVDLDRFYVKVTYRNLPQKPLGLDYKSFVVEPIFTSAMGKIFSTDEVKDKFTIEGFKRVEENGDIKIKFHVEDIMLTRTEVKNRVEEAKDKAGKVTSRKTYYWFEIEYSMNAKADVYNSKNQQLLQSFNLDGRDSKYTYTLSETSSYNGARDSYLLNKDMVIRNIISSKFEGYYSTINNFLTQNYGYKVISENELVWIQNSKKHPEYEPYINIYNTMKDIFSQMTPDLPLNQEKIQPVIDYLNGLVKKYTTNEKPDRKLRYSAFYNLGKIYLYLDMPDEVIKQGNALITNDYDTGDGKRLIESANKLKELFEKNKLTSPPSRHFERNLSETL